MTTQAGISFTDLGSKAMVPAMEGTPAQQRAAVARAALIRKTDEKYAQRLRSHGWTVIPPEASTDTKA